jgi:hypothetical protein
MSVARTFLALVAVVLLLGAQSCDREITRVESNKPLSCADCHNASSLITGKQTEWAESVHATGTAYVRASSASCAGCHSGNGFQQMVEAGENPDTVEQGQPDPTRQDCRACHQIHETYSMADFALTTEEPVQFIAIEGVTFKGGEGNLCANCHQPRRGFPEPENGMITGISSHWGPHHGPQSAMLLGVAGAGDVESTVSPHYGAVDNTCVGCHMGETLDHHFEPALATCQRCHPEATSFDYKGVQTEIEDLGDQLGALLLNAGLINENSEDGHPTVTEAPVDQAVALYNWIYVMHEDKSEGVHNPDYAKALLEEGLSRMGASAASTH